VWFQITLELPDRPGRTLRRVEGPSFHATEPGGDGLAVWERLADEAMTFCLWEIKSYTGAKAVAATLRRAYGQLSERSMEYLAKLTGIEAAAREDPRIDDLYANLLELWTAESDRRAAGVAVATGSSFASASGFATMAKHLPGFTQDWQLEGLIAAIGDFKQFTFDVRERVWNVL